MPFHLRRSQARRVAVGAETLPLRVGDYIAHIYTGACSELEQRATMPLMPEKGALHMIWATRLVLTNEVASIERLFRDQAEAFDLGAQMQLVFVNEEWPSVRLWVAVPDSDLLAPYYGFQPCSRSDLPIAPTLVGGCPRRFASIFHGF